MKVFADHRGLAIRLSEERLMHILDHPEMTGLDSAISETLSDPELVIQSISDEAARLYYRFYSGTRAGDKFLCVVVKVTVGDAFVLTAYLTDKPKRGTILWSAST